MAEAQFTPGQGASSILSASNNGLNAGFSMMERSQELQLNKERAAMARAEEERRQQQFQVLMPAMAAKSTADQVQARVAVSGLEQTERTRAAAASIIPQAREEFDSLMQLSDPDAREEAGLEWIGKYGHLDNVSEYAKEFASKKDIVGKLHLEASALRHLDATIKGQKEVAQVRADGAVAAAKEKADAPDKIERYRNKLIEAQQSGDTEAEALYSGLLNKAVASPINTANGSEQMQKKLEEARAAGDPVEVEFWQKRINALNQRGVRKDPAALVDAIVKGLGGDTATPAAAAAKPAPPAAGADPFSKIKL